MSMATRRDGQSAALHAPDSRDLIRVHGAPVNNLKDLVTARSTLTGGHPAAYVGA
jgi:hypothetical protein